jgi:DNA polymerase III epsilon subunit-like protein
MIFADKNLAIEAEHEFLIKPTDWEMVGEAAEITGLTTEILREQGIELAEPMKLYASGLDAGRVVVGHSVSFDVKMMRAELRRCGMDDRYIRTRTICTMQGSRAICKIPNANGKGTKVPKLEEAATFFGIDQPKKHSALADAHTCLGILRKLHEINAMPAPKSPLDKHRVAS